MALQINVTKVSAVSQGEGGTLTLNMKCWSEGADPQADDPVLQIEKSAYIKKRVECVTGQQLVNRATKEIGKAFQAAIDRYKNEQTILSMVNTNAVEDALTG